MSSGNAFCIAGSAHMPIHCIATRPWLIALGSGLGVVGFLLPWADRMNLALPAYDERGQKPD